MHDALNRNMFFVREKIGAFKAVNEYDFLDPESEQMVFQSTEEIGWFTKLLRFSDYKTISPFNVIIGDPGGKQVIRVSRGFSFFRSRVTVFDDADRPVGRFLQKLLSIGGAFRLLDMNDNEMGMLQGDWTSWDFTFQGSDGGEIGRVTKEWAGIGKEMFTTADNYMLVIDDSVPGNHPLRMMILGAVVCIDMVLKESR